MATAHCTACECSGSGTSERLRYFPRQLLTADDMRAEQEYFREKLRRHNRFLHGAGVVCGLEVVRGEGGLEIVIGPGYALGPWGDEIYVPECTPIDLAHCVSPRNAPCQPQTTMQSIGDEVVKLLVKIRYAECPTRPMRTLPAGCGCDETACEYSRTRDGFELQCFLAEEEPEAAVAIPDLPACMQCPAGPWLLLAEVDVQANELLTIETQNRAHVESPASAPATT